MELDVMSNMHDIVIRENIEKYMTELKQWLESIKADPLEQMSEFFTSRVGSYEEHMARWKEAYAHMAVLVPENTETLLDIGCGTGLELDEIFKLHPDIKVVGVDLAQVMLDRLTEKHSERNITLICGDYFITEYENEHYDAAVSFETLHHFKPEKKLELFKKLYSALKPGGLYIDCDYLACCVEEEELLFNESRRKRGAEGIPEDIYVHFDTPLTAGHEIALLRKAGFTGVELTACINGAAIIISKKPNNVKS
jgi:tRNA (cmo5U34)-methyltransferase